MSPWNLALKLFLGLTKNRFLTFFSLCEYVCGEREWWEYTSRGFTVSRLLHICYNWWSDWVLRGHKRLGYMYTRRIVWDSCSSFHHYWDWVWPLSCSQNSLWISNSPRVGLHCYWMWFSKTTLHFEFASLSGCPPHCFRGRGWRRAEDLASTHISLYVFPLWYMT